MYKIKAKLIFAGVLLMLISTVYSSCKSKKAAITIKAPEVAKTPEVQQPTTPPEAVKEVDTDGDGIPDAKDNCPDDKGTASNNGCPVEVEKAFNYKNIQFEFNSSVLKTSSYAVLEEIATEMKKHPQATFQLNGNSSAEGTAHRNMMLSVDRANAVKAYLVNSGIKGSQLKTKGFGESMPLVPNTSEANRAINRRVEIKPFY